MDVCIDLICRGGGGNRISDRNINVLYCPYKSGYYQVKEAKSLSHSTIVCNRVGTGEVIKYKREGLTRWQKFVI